MSKKRNRELSKRGQEIKKNLAKAPALDATNDVREIEAKPIVFNEKQIPEVIEADSGVVTEATQKPILSPAEYAKKEQAAIKAGEQFVMSQSIGAGAAPRNPLIGAKEHKGAEGMYININDTTPNNKESVVHDPILTTGKTHKTYEEAKPVEEVLPECTVVPNVIDTEDKEILDSLMADYCDAKETEDDYGVGPIPQKPMNAEAMTELYKQLMFGSLALGVASIGKSMMDPADHDEVEKKLLAFLINKYNVKHPKLTSKNSDIVLTATYINYTVPHTEENNSIDMMPVIRKQQLVLEKAIEKNGRILYCTNENVPALASGCLFGLGRSTDNPVWAKGREGSITITIDPSQYNRFIEQFAIGSVAIMPYRNSFSDSTLEQIADGCVANDAKPFIQLDMCKIFDCMNEFYGKSDEEIEFENCNYNLGWFKIRQGISSPTNLRACGFIPCLVSNNSFSDALYNRLVKTPNMLFNEAVKGASSASSKRLFGKMLSI